jgi:hypothetical protein
MGEVEAKAGFKGHLGIVVTRAHPTTRSRLADAWAAFLRRFRP